MERYSLLVADDNREWRELLLSALLQESWLEILPVAEDGKQAWERIWRDLPDILLMDAIMPEMDAFQVLRKVREELPGYQPVIYLYSGMHSDFIREQVDQLHVDYFTMLPTPLEYLLEHLRRTVSQRMSNCGCREVGQEIRGLLDALGLRPRTKYRLYTACCLQLCREDPTRLNMVTKVLYPEAAHLCHVEDTAIEHGVRHAIRVALRHKTPLFCQLFPRTETLSNSLFLEGLWNYLNKLSG
ncbi:MAG: sporulation initiation factor Spo0A C-terminal domain-containing protein [Eubacteriales bacterium]